MAKHDTRLSFALMAAVFKIRDRFSPPQKKLNEAGLDPGMVVLDYGCGPGAYTLAAAEIVGLQGRIIAVDANTWAVGTVQEKIRKKGRTNIETVLTECETGLEPESVDVVLLYDVFHALDDQEAVLKELHRVLKPYGTISFSDHHMKEAAAKEAMTRFGLFRFSHRGIKTLTFVKGGGRGKGEG